MFIYLWRLLMMCVRSLSSMTWLYRLETEYQMSVRLLQKMFRVLPQYYLAVE